MIDSDALRARREQRRRAIRRRRRIAASMLVLVVAAAVAAAVLANGRSTTGGKAARVADASTPTAGRSHQPTKPPAVPATSQPVGAPGQEPVPILMYHVIAPPPPGAPYPGLYVEPAEFAEQMRALKGAGFHAVTLDEVEAYWRRGVPLGPGKPVVISFDNGYNSQYAQALPVLRRLGWVGDENLQLSGLPPSQGGLSRTQIRGLLAAGWELDTQGISHAALITLDAEQLHYQVAVARQTLQRRYHVPVNWFCYPSGQYDATVEAAVKEAGFIGSTTVVPGWAHPSDDPYRLHRLRVLGGTSAQQLLELIAGSREDGPAPDAYTA